MPSLNDALRNIEQEGGDIRFQMLNQCTTKVQDKKRTKDTDITFCTEQTTADELMRGTGKVGIVVWVDRDAWDKQLIEVEEKVDDTEPLSYTHDQLWEAVYVLLPNIRIARESGTNLNLPQTLYMVGADYFMSTSEERDQFTKEKVGAYELCRAALIDLKRDGHFNYAN